jgi:hypothetical protein
VEWRTGSLRRRRLDLLWFKAKTDIRALPSLLQEPMRATEA